MVSYFHAFRLYYEGIASALVIFANSSLRYVDGWAVNIWHIFVFLKNGYDMFFCWFQIREIKSCHMLMAQPSTYMYFTQHTYIFYLLPFSFLNMCQNKLHYIFYNHSLQIHVFAVMIFVSMKDNVISWNKKQIRWEKHKFHWHCQLIMAIYLYNWCPSL